MSLVSGSFLERGRKKDVLEEKFKQKTQWDVMEDSFQENINNLTSNPATPNNPGNEEKEEEPIKETPETGVQPFEPITGDPATGTTFPKELHFPPMLVTVNVDELSELVQFLEGLKAPQLKAQVVKWYFRAQSFQQWAEQVRNMWKMASEKGLGKVTIPAPPLESTEDITMMREMLKVMSPIMAMKAMLGGESSGEKMIDVVNAFKEMKTMVEGEKKYVKIDHPELGEIEVTPEIALLYKSERKGENMGNETITIEYADGTKKHVPRDLYPVEVMRDILEKHSGEKEKPGGEPSESRQVVASLLGTIDSLSALVNHLASELEDIKKTLKEGGGLAGLKLIKDNIETLGELYEALEKWFGRKNPSGDKYSLLRALVEGKETEENKEQHEVDIIIQRSRQISEQELRELEEEAKKAEEVGIKEITEVTP